MSEPRYQIIFSTLIEGRHTAKVYHDLSDLFKIGEELVERIFACQGAVVKSDLDRAAAEQYVQIILAAGAICVIEPMPSASGATDDKAGLQPAAHVLPPDRTGRDPDKAPARETCSAHVADQKLDFVLRMDTDAGSAAGDRTSRLRAPGLAALMLLAGAVAPVMSGSGQLYWPWRFMFEPQPPGLLWWVIVPLAAAGLIVLLRSPAFSLAVSVTGAAVALLCMFFLWEAALIVPLRIMPVDRAGALCFVVAFLGAALCSAACNAMENLGELIMLRLLAACGSLAVLIPVCAVLFNSGPVWGRWSLILLLLLLLLYAGMTCACALLPAVPETLLNQVRLLGLLLLFWAPPAVFLAHLPLGAPDTAQTLLWAVFKTAMLYYGALAAAAGGLRNEFLYRFER